MNQEGAGDLASFDRIGTSELSLIECSRVLDRYRLQNLLSDDQLAEAREALQIVRHELHLFEISSAAKRRASESFPTIIGTLDAIHLASALLWRQSRPEEVFVQFSYDRRFNTFARALGFRLHAAAQPLR